jgi:hypothetical protein
MTQEEKDLLIKDLCGRLRYNVIVRCYFVDGGGEEVLDTDDIADLLYNDEDSEFPMYKPYLRPLSNMTEEEEKELSKSMFGIFGVDKYRLDTTVKVAGMMNRMSYRRIYNTI